MDINDLRGIATVFTMIGFLAVVFWAYSSKRKERFDEAANLPFADDEDRVTAAKNTEKKDNE